MSCMFDSPNVTSYLTTFSSKLAWTAWVGRLFKLTFTLWAMLTRLSQLWVVSQGAFSRWPRWIQPPVPDLFLFCSNCFSHLVPSWDKSVSTYRNRGIPSGCEGIRIKPKAFGNSGVISQKLLCKCVCVCVSLWHMSLQHLWRLSAHELTLTLLSSEFYSLKREVFFF